MSKLSKPSPKDIEHVETQDVLEKLWDQEFSTTYELKELSKNTVDYLESINRKLKKGVLLDCGCGTGRIKRYFEDNDWKCFGTDITKESLKIASKFTPINLIYTVTHDLPFKDNYFDLIIFWRVLHNIMKKVRHSSIKELNRVLKIHGTFICCVQAKEDWETFCKYKENGIELKDDLDTFAVNQQIGTKNVTYIKHFYTKDEIVKEIESQSSLKVNKIIEFEEQSGLEALDKRMQKYWIVEATKSV